MGSVLCGLAQNVTESLTAGESERRWWFLYPVCVWVSHRCCSEWAETQRFKAPLFSCSPGGGLKGMSLHTTASRALAPDCFLASARPSLEASDPSAQLSSLCPRSQLVLFLFCSHIGSHQSRSFTESPLQSPSVMSGPGDSDMMDAWGTIIQSTTTVSDH